MLLDIHSRKTVSSYGLFGSIKFKQWVRWDSGFSKIQGCQIRVTWAVLYKWLHRWTRLLASVYQLWRTCSQIDATKVASQDFLSFVSVTKEYQHQEHDKDIPESNKDPKVLETLKKFSYPVTCGWFSVRECILLPFQVKIQNGSCIDEQCTKYD